MEEVRCCVCDPAEAETLFTSGQYGIKQCQRCHLVFTSPRLDSAERTEVYSSQEYFSAGRNPYGRQRCGFDYVRNLDQRSLEEPRRRFRIVEKHCGKKSTLLDVGAGVGLNLIPVLEACWACNGIELSPFASRVAEGHGIPVITGAFNAEFVDAVQRRGEMYDVTTMYHVLEHMDNPLTSLRLSSEIIRSGGHLIIEVPDFGSKYAQALRDEWPELKPWEHLYHFTEDSLNRLGALAGFTKEAAYHHGGIGAALAPRSSSPVHVNAMRALLFQMRRIVYIVQPLKDIIRFVYWEVMRNHNIMTLVYRRNAA